MYADLPLVSHQSPKGRRTTWPYGERHQLPRFDAFFSDEDLSMNDRGLPRSQGD